MWRLWLFLLGVLMLAGSVCAGGTLKPMDLWFVTQGLAVQSNDNKGGSASLYPGEAVKVLQSNESNSLVTPWPESFTFKPVWIPKKHLARLAAFKPLYAWHGDKHYTIGAGDYDATYEFHSDGTFKLVEPALTVDSQGADHHYGMVTRHGRLYQSGSAIWARTTKPKSLNNFPQAELSYMFYLKPNGSLCYGYLGPCEDH